MPQFTGLAPLIEALVRTGVLSERPVRAPHRRVKALWNMLSDYGLAVAVIRWWATWPAEEVNGWLVSDERPREHAQRLRAGKPAGAGVTHPPEFLRRVSELGDDAPMGAGLWEAFGREKSRALPLFEDIDNARFAALAEDPRFLELAWNCFQDDRFGVAVASELLTTEQVAYLTVYTRSIDVLGHRLAKHIARDEQYMRIIERAYEESDRLLATLLGGCSEETTLLVVSDHGWSFEPRHYGHYHGPPGMFLLWGSGVARGAQLAQPPTVLDVAPTVLALLGLPRSLEMPGRVPFEILTPEIKRIQPIASYGSHRPRWSFAPGTGAASAGDDEEIERLRELGYVQ